MPDPCPRAGCPAGQIRHGGKDWRQAVAGAGGHLQMVLVSVAGAAADYQGGDPECRRLSRQARNGRAADTSGDVAPKMRHEVDHAIHPSRVPAGQRSRVDSMVLAASQPCSWEREEAGGVLLVVDPQFQSATRLPEVLRRTTCAREAPPRRHASMLSRQRRAMPSRTVSKSR